MSSFLLKLLGIILMTFDHTRILICNTSEFLWMENIGRLAFPIFAFQIVVGYKKTHDLKKYILRLLLFAIISEVAFKWMIWLATKDLQQTIWNWNVYWTFILGLISLRILNDDKLKSIYKGMIIAAICILFSIFYVDYSFYGIGIMIAYYYLFPFKKENNKNSKINSIGLIVILAALSTIFTVFINAREGGRLPMYFLAPYAAFTFAGSLIPFLSNGRKGWSNKFTKWMFYIYYPLHITVLCLINIFIH